MSVFLLQQNLINLESKDIKDFKLVIKQIKSISFYLNIIVVLLICLSGKYITALLFGMNIFYMWFVFTLLDETIKRREAE